MNFTELLEELNIPTAPTGHHHSTEGWIQFDCPFCGPGSGNYHMGYNLEGGFVNCWRCGSHSLVSVLQAYTGWAYPHIRGALDQIEEIHPHVKEKPSGRLQYPSHVGSLKKAHLAYLTHRGFDPHEIQQLWQIKGISISPRLPWRIFIPIIHRGQIVSWTTRSLSDKGRRYISAESSQETIPHKHILYGQDYVRHATIIVEGPLDVWAIGPGAVATFGTDFTKEQVRHLCHIPRRIVCYDNESFAQRQAEKLVNHLGAFPGETINIILDAKDAAATQPAEREKLRKFLT